MSRMASVPMPDVIIMKNHITMKQMESTRSVMPDNYMPTQIMHQTVYTKGARLTADIVVNEGTLIQEDGTPVAKTYDIRMWDEVFRTSGYPYNNKKLVFDGNNHSISGLYANGSGPQGFALYNYGTIKNLQIKNSVFISTDGNAGGIVAGFPIGPADYKVVFVGVFTVCFGILSTARVKKREVFLLRSKVLFANSLCYFNTCVFPMYFPIVSPCR